MPDYVDISHESTGYVVTSADWDQIADDLKVHQDVQALTIVNSTGSGIARGYVGVLDPSSPTHLIAATSGADERRVVVVQSPTIASTLSGYGQVIGRCGTVNVQGAVAHDDLLETDAVAGYARSGSTRPFARALSAFAGPGAGAVIALLTPPMEGGTFPLGVPDASHGPVTFNISDTTLHSNIIVAPGTGLSIYIVKVRAQNFNTTATLLSVIAHLGHTEIYPIAGVTGSGVDDYWNQKPWKIGNNVALDMQQSALANLYGSIDFYVASA